MRIEVEDIYFLTGLPFWGTPLSAVPMLPRDTQLRTVTEKYYSGEDYMTGTSVRISGIDVWLWLWRICFRFVGNEALDRLVDLVILNRSIY